MKSTDDTVKDYFTLKSQGKTNGRKLFRGEFFINENLSKNIDLKDWQTKLETKLWNVTDPFDHMLEKVKKWVNDYDMLPKLISDNEIEKKYAKWCQSHKCKKELSQEKINKLESIKEWKWSVPIDKTKPTFKNELLQEIKNVSNKDGTFKRKNIDDDKIAKIVKSKGKTPGQTINRMLQDFRDKNIIEFLDNEGTYKIKHNN